MSKRGWRVAPLAAVVSVLSFGVTTDAVSQGLREARPRHMFGGSLILARPVGEFQDFVDWGGGFDVFGVFGLGRSGVIGLRLDGSVVIYGHESVDRPFSSTIPYVWLEVQTTNSIASIGLGPQVTLGRGPLRPYVYGTVGLSYFSTTTSLRGTGSVESFASSTNLDDVTPAVTGGAGLLLRLSNGRKPVSLDFSVNTTLNGEAEYLRVGSVRERADGTVYFVPIRSQANLVTFRMGVTASVF